jgi:uncharacterized membrane protein
MKNLFPLDNKYVKFLAHFKYKCTHVMWYNYLKFFHLLSAAFLLVSMVYSFHLWKKIQHGRKAILLSQRIQVQTVYYIIPLVILQLATGISMISLQQDAFSHWWISVSIIGFIIIVGSWFSFIYFLLVAQQLSTEEKNALPIKYSYFRRAQSIMLFLCATAILSMIFLMANKSALYANHP